ncbi:MAG: hypothetical protein IT337_16930 [Thermomicrobiales bacterium]|nr:hypothetical protein [Thermomicrobiales bacterium]
MARRRYLSTKISTDTAVNKLAQQGGDFAALLYTWMIPHAGDDATLTGDPEELLLAVMPGRRDKTPEDIANALQMMVDLDLIEWDGKTVTFPADAFYRHQSYIKDGPRRGANNSAEQRTPEDNSANQRKSAQNPASLSFKSSSSFPSSSSSSPPTTTSTEVGDSPPTADQPKPKPTRSTKTPIPEDLVDQIPPETWALLRAEQKLTDEQLRFETSLMIDHFRGKGERRPDWVATWRKWMRSEYRQSKPLPPDPVTVWARPGGALVAPEHRRAS